MLTDVPSTEHSRSAAPGARSRRAEGSARILPAARSGTAAVLDFAEKITWGLFALIAVVGIAFWAVAKVISAGLVASVGDAAEALLLPALMVAIAVAAVRGLHALGSFIARRLLRVRARGTHEVGGANTSTQKPSPHHDQKDPFQ